jgi:hypothetical protein
MKSSKRSDWYWLLRLALLSLFFCLALPLSSQSVEDLQQAEESLVGLQELLESLPPGATIEMPVSDLNRWVGISLESVQTLISTDNSLQIWEQDLANLQLQLEAESKVARTRFVTQTVTSSALLVSVVVILWMGATK